MSCKGECLSRHGEYVSRYAGNSPSCVDRAVLHVATIDERHCHDGVIRYSYSCSCGNACGTRETESEARAGVREHEPDVQLPRATFPFQVLATNPRKAG